MAINSKSKGSKNERNLSKWWEGWSGLEFQRVPASGGLRWGNTQNITGDIICSDERHSRRFPFSIEAKSVKDIRFEHYSLGLKTNKVDEFWGQAKADGERAGKIPILFMRYNGMPASNWLVIMDYKVYQRWCYSKGVNKFPVIYIHTEKEKLVLMNSTDLNTVDYTEFIIKIKKLRRNGK